MDNSNFIQKLARLKREVNALKTSHSRGVGLIKLYSRSTSVDVSSTSGFFNIIVSVTISRQSPAFPLLTMRADYVPEELYVNGSLSGLGYSPDGYTITGSFFALFNSSISTRNIRVVSTSVIEEINYTIED